MARISRDDSSWKARSILRRDSRHDLEHLSDEASNGKVRASKRKARKGCEHEFPPQPTQEGTHGTLRCLKCGKRTWYSNWRWYRRRPDAKDAHTINRQAVAKEAFFPVHSEGTCATCDERRRHNAG